MTLQDPRREFPGAGSPLTRGVFAGPPRPALVLAAFPTALYLAAGEHHEVLPVLTSDALMLPTGIRLSAPARDISWGVEPGDTVSVGHGVVDLPGWRVRVIRDWRPARVRALPTLADRATVSDLADLLSQHATRPELVEQATAVCRAARSADQAELRRTTRRLLGFGQGLTPSGDDVLCAVLLVLNGIGDRAPLELLADTIREDWSRTTSLSASLLDAATSGYAVPVVAALVDSALRGDLAGVRATLAPTLAIGHSSGRDLVAGLAGSLRALADANDIGDRASQRDHTARRDHTQLLHPTGR